jgi:hypothetical protein
LLPALKLLSAQDRSKYTAVNKTPRQLCWRGVCVLCWFGGVLLFAKEMPATRK